MITGRRYKWKRTKGIRKSGLEVFVRLVGIRLLCDGESKRSMRGLEGYYLYIELTAVGDHVLRSYCVGLLART